MEEQKFIDYAKSVQLGIYFYSSVLIVPLGVLFNSITFAIFSSRKFRKTNYGFISSVLAIFDSLSLFWSYFIYKYLVLLNPDFFIRSSFFCFSLQYFSRVIQMLPIYIQVFLTAFQYFEIKFTIKKYFKNKNYILAILLLLFASVFLLNIPNLFKYTKHEYLNSTLNQTIEIRYCKHHWILSIVSDFETAFLRTLFPLIIFCILNFLIARALIKSKRKFTKKTHKLKREYQYAFSLFLINFIFVIFNFPLTITYILVNVYENFLGLAKESILIRKMEFIHLTTNAIAFFYNTLSFFVNLIFNFAFRRELFLMLKLVFRKNKYLIGRGVNFRTNDKSRSIIETFIFFVVV